jgi:Zn-dependent membrane protease YugP
MPEDILYILLFVVSLAIGFGTQAYINSQYRKYDKLAVSSGMTGAQVARRMLDAYGLVHIQVQMIPGKLTDNFDPRSNVISLSEAVFNGRSVSATAIACHECGHAVQHAQSYAPAAFRRVLWPLVNVASNLWLIALFIGIALSFVGLIWVAVIMYAFVLLFQLVTLPVEFNASKRAIAYIGTGGYLPDQEYRGTRKVLSAAALTYVAGALISVIQLLRLLGMANRR